MHHIKLFAFLVLGSATLLLGACGDTPGSASDSIVGTWQLDTSALKEAAREGMEKELEGKEGEMAEMMRDRMETMLAAMDDAHMSVTLTDDGNWTGESGGPNESTGERETTTSRGTWSLEGDKVVIVTTHRNGKAVNDPDKVEGTWDGNVIRVDGKGSEPDLVMRRK